MRIAILAEGETEGAFRSVLHEFLKPRLVGRMPRLQFINYKGRIPKEDKLKYEVENLLTGRDAYDAVIALTDVYTGTSDFSDAADAKAKMAEWTNHNPNFYPHAAQHDFEAWLLPFWPTIQKLAGHNKAAPRGLPEKVSHHHPPADRIKELYRIGSKGKRYVKPRDGLRILRDNDLLVSAAQCPELKAFLNRILRLCGGDAI